MPPSPTGSASDETGIIGGEPGGDIADVLGPADPLERGGGGQGGDDGATVKAAEHIGVDNAGQQRIDADIVRPRFNSHRQGKGLHRPFACGIGGCANKGRSAGF